MTPPSSKLFATSALLSVRLKCKIYTKCGFVGQITAVSYTHLLKRDGLTLRGELLKPDVEKCPILIIFHGFMANIGKDDKSMFYQIAHECLNNGIACLLYTSKRRMREY